MLCRRQFLSCAAAFAVPNDKLLRGVFPIALSPFTDRNALDIEALVRQYRLMHRTGVHGFVWPQLASEWDTLTVDERLAGAEALGKEAAKSRPALVIGIQAWSASQAVAFARHAQKCGATAVISLPPPGESNPAALLSYFREAGAATSLPFFIQATGQFSTNSILELHRAVPALRFVKDEAGQPLARFDTLRSGSNGKLAVFSGGHGKTMLEEARRGFAGTMPATSFADLYARAWDAMEKRDLNAALDPFGQATILINEIIPYADAMKYILHLRGAFPNYRLREKSPGANASRLLLDATAKSLLADLVRRFHLPS